MKKKIALIKSGRIIRVKDGKEAPPTCPKCKSELDAYTGADLNGKEWPSPKTGDLSVCAYCLSVLRYEEDSSMTLVSEQEVQLMDARNRDLLESYRQMIRSSRNETIPRSSSSHTGPGRR